MYLEIGQQNGNIHVMLFKLGNTVHVTMTIQTVQILYIKASNLRVFYKQHVPYQHPNFKTIIYSCFMCHIGAI